MPDHPHHAIGSDSEDEHESDGEDVSSTEDRRHASYLGMNDREEDGEDGEANLTGVEEDEKLLNKPSAILDGTEGETQLEDEEKGHHPPRSTSVLPLQLEGSAAHRSRRRSLSRVGEDAGRRLLGVVRLRTALLVLLAALAVLVGLWLWLPERSISPPPSQIKAQTRPGAPARPARPQYSMAKVGPSWSDILGEKPAPQPDHTGMKSNGTHYFRETVLIISLDGVRADYLDRGLTPHLLSISKKGIRAEYLQPIFPTLTFPNHWSILTGLYAESHGILANDFWDPVDNEEFLYTDSSKSWKSKWWGGEPMWSTAGKNGMKSAVLMWPGPPEMSDGARPTYFAPFQNHVSWKDKLAQIEQWLDFPDEQRPQLICGYLPEVDIEGHRTGPDSSDLQDKLRYVDDFAKALDESLSKRRLTDIVDVIFVSDHGMTPTANERLVYLDDVLGEDGFKGIGHKSGWPLSELTFKDGVDETLMVERMLAGAAASKGGFAYYTPDTMPREWHYSKNAKIAKHILVPEVGWAITDRHEHLNQMKGNYEPIGNHGYNNSHPDMHAIFVAHGPFATRLRQQKQKRNAKSMSGVEVIPGFSNTELYNLVTRTLLKATKVAPSNGTDGFWEQYTASL